MSHPKAIRKRRFRTVTDATFGPRYTTASERFVLRVQHAFRRLKTLAVRVRRDAPRRQA